MSLESDLLFAQQAIKLGFVEEAAVSEALRVCDGHLLPDELVRRKLLTPGEVAAVHAVVEALLKRKSATATPPVAPPAAEPPPPAPLAPASGIVGTVALVRPRFTDRETAHGRLSASGASRTDALLDGQIVISLGTDSSGLFDKIVARAGLKAAGQDADLVEVPEGALPRAARRDRRLLVSRKVPHGRSLEEMLRDARKKGQLQEVLEESRFLRAFRDACMAMGFMHGIGLVHRQLTPHAVLLGEGGEVVVTDWDEARPAQEPPGAAQLSLVGSCYSAPELSGDGKTLPADPRSDVYSLGAILYRVVARRVPFTGEREEEILSQQFAGPPSAPSTLGVAVSRELEKVCLKALSPRPDLRHADAGVLLAEFESALAGDPGVKKHADAAAAHVELAQKAFEAYQAAQAEAVFQHLEARSSEVRWGAASELTREAVQAAGKAEKEAVEALKEAEANIAAALELVKNHREARRLKAEIHWAEFRHAEDAGDERSSLVHLQVVSQFNDGEFDVQLRGEGTLSVTTEAYRCPCLRTGRPVLASEAVRLGYQVASGRAVDGDIAAEGIRTLEWARPAVLNVHGKSCVKHPSPGADVWVFRLLPHGPLRVPASSGHGFPTATGGTPMPVLRALFEQNSPFLASLGGKHVGQTPVKRLALPAGSYLLVVSMEGSRPVRVPVWVGRCESVEARVTLYAPDDIPPGFVQVSQGKFGWQGDRDNPHSLHHEVLSLPDNFISRDPVTCREYAEYLRDLARTNPMEAEARAPRRGPAGPPMWPDSPWGPPADAGPDGKWQLPGCHVPWDPTWPVLGVSWEDALHYCAWLRGHKPWMFTIPHEFDWEKAARGPDRRRFPWGNGFDPSLSNSAQTLKDGARPVAVGTFPRDESPYGVRGMAGNSRDFCMNSPGADFPEARILRGGYWNGTGVQLASSYRSTAATRHVSPKGGFRLALIPSL